jgi:uncharacterized protein
VRVARSTAWSRSSDLVALSHKGVELPVTAAWRHVGARDGFEVLFLQQEEDGYRFRGHATAVEEGVTWSVVYTIVLDAGWATRTAHVLSRSTAGERECLIERHATAGWRVNGRHAPELSDCEDVDLEASAFTNAFPVHRLRLEVGESADAPAAYVRAPNLRVARLEQRYLRLPDDGARACYDYEAPAFEFRDVLVYDELGLILEYPGIAVRAA